MKSIGRLILLGAFAILGVGLAVCVGTVLSGLSLRSEPVEVESVAAEAEVALVHEDRQPSLQPVPEPVASGTKKPKPTVAVPSSPERPAPVAISSPVSTATAPVLISPDVLYAQQSPQVPPAPQGGMAPVLDLLRKGMTGGRATPLPPPPAEGVSQRPKATVNGEGDGKLRIHIYDEDLRKVLDLLSEQGNLNILASKNVDGKVSATLNGVDVDSALRAILRSTGFVARREGSFIFVGTPEDFNSMEQGMDRIGTRVYRPNYITAGELKTLITPLLTDKTGVVSISSPSEVGIPTTDSGAGGDKYSGGEAIVVRDYEAVLCQIDQMVAEVDVRPLQVAIEAMILSVHLKDEDKFGVNFQLLRQNPNIKFGLGSPATSLSDAAFPLNGGLKFGFLDSNLGAFIEALETVGDTNVVANPRLMVLNKQRAEIQIGEKKGYINQTVTETSSTQSVAFLDIGAQLRLRPFISPDGLIRMEVHPELSDGDVTVVNNMTLPNKTVTQVTTNIMVRDGCTVIIGGLIKEQLTTTTTQLPVLGNLPVVGIAFRQSDEKTDRHEVLVLITPRIVYEPGTCQEGAKNACDFLRRQSTYADKMSPFGKRSIARRYYRLAEKAYAEGDNDKALRMAEMAVQFDPLDRASLELRTDIWLGKPNQPAATVTAESPSASPDR